MKKLIFLLLLIITFFANAQNEKYINRSDEYRSFQPNEVVYTFGNNVKLRSEPNTNSETILKIPIAKKLTVLGKSEAKMLYNGIHWNWYKVNYNNKIGYVLGGLLAQDTKIIHDDVYVISLKKKSEELYILTRLVNNGIYQEHSNKFNTDVGFIINIFDSRGVPNIKNMIYINYMAEGCGINGGGYYLFNDGNTLKKAIELFSLVEAGLYGYNEDVIFPNDKGGKKGKIIYIEEKEETINEQTNEVKTEKRTLELVWKGKELKPKL